MLQSTLSFNYNTAPTPEMNTYIAGVTFENRQNILRSIVSHMRKYGNNKIKFIVVREPNNPYDHNACQVLVKKLNAKNATWMQIGYIPAQYAKEIAPLIDKGAKLQTTAFSIHKSYRKDTLGANITLRIQP